MRDVASSPILCRFCWPAGLTLELPNLTTPGEVSREDPVERLRRALQHRKLHCGWDEDEYVVVVEHEAKTWKDKSVVWSNPPAAAGAAGAAVPAAADAASASGSVPEPPAYGVCDGDGGAVPCCVELKNIPTDISWEQLKEYCLSFGKLAALQTT